ncbi:hypothetical protein [Kitasatospora sp. NPDC086791]|uniref:hypothetical protein n=1 Tax=Kitasatospora sp. NPDC086791 TaxID=3155178 RepID=UPI003442B96A
MLLPKSSTPVTGGMLSGGGPVDRMWRAEFRFKGQPGVPATNGLPGIAGTADTRGWLSCDSFERLAAQLIATAARQWWDLEPPREMIDFGEVLLRHGRQIAERQRRWTYATGAHHEWADVTVTYHPIGG